MKRRAKYWIIGVVLIFALLLCFMLSRGEREYSSGNPLPLSGIEPQLLSELDTGVLLAPDGSLWIWGGTEHWFVSLFGKSNTTSVPLRIGTDRDWRKVAAHSSHMLALKTDGSLWAWGNWPGSPAGETFPPSVTPRRVDSGADWKEVSVGVTHCMAIKRDGSLWTWGRNHYGQLGTGITNDVAIPTRIGNDRWTAIAAGAFNSYAVREDGTLWGWGLDPIRSRPSINDVSPRLIDPEPNWVAIRASSYALLALRRDGSIWLTGQNARWTAPDFVTNVTATLTRIGPDADWKSIYCGEQHFFARKTDGSWWACGGNDDAQFGLGSKASTQTFDSPQRLPFSFDSWAIALGRERGTTLVLLKDGSLWTSGIRLGEPKPSQRFNGLKLAANRVLLKLPGQPYFPIRQFKTDTVPHKFWQLPPEVVGRLIESNTNVLPH